MKRFISAFLLIVLLAGCGFIEEEKPEKVNTDISAVWMYFSELSMKEYDGGSEELFRDKMNKMFSDCADMGINNVFFHVRPYGDAFYESEIFPWSAYLTGTQGKAVEYDPLEIAIETAHGKNIKLHAWINPFRIAVSEDLSLLSEDNPALEMIKEKSPDVVNVNGGYYYSPASPDAQRLIIDGVREIVENYDVDGIHIDDYFYPSTDESVDGYFYNEYKENGGELKLDEWRLNTVSAFVSQLYGAAKSVSGECIFSISPQGNIKNNYREQYADVKLWISRRGYCDWMIPQIYYGFENEILPFDNALNAWAALDRISDVKLICGVGAYRVNESDKEWNAGSGIIDKQISLIKGKSCSGAAFFSYSSLVDTDKAPEFSNLASAFIPQVSS